MYRIDTQTGKIFTKEEFEEYWKSCCICEYKNLEKIWNSLEILPPTNNIEEVRRKMSYIYGLPIPVKGDLIKHSISDPNSYFVENVIDEDIYVSNIVTYENSKWIGPYIKIESTTISLMRQQQILYNICMNKLKNLVEECVKK